MPFNIFIRSTNKFKEDSKKPEKSKTSSIPKSKNDDRKSPQWQQSNFMPVNDADYQSSLRYQPDAPKWQQSNFMPVKDANSLKDTDFQSSLRYQTEVRFDATNKEKIADSGISIALKVNFLYVG